MSQAALKYLRYLNPGNFTGPIFAKELRVASRRRRNYALRFAYLLILTVIVALIWMEEVGSIGSYDGSAYTASRMSDAGQTITAVIVWFQFAACQLVTIILMSTAISDEIYHRTLGGLMSTPITSLQIVMGKLLSRCLGVLILLGVSIPLMMLVRVFGGVPWEFILASTCITLTAVLFAAAVSLWFSIHTRHAYAVIVKTILVGGIIWALAPFLIIHSMVKILNWGIPIMEIFGFLANLNPFVAMSIIITELFSPSFAGQVPLFSWQRSCLYLTAMSAGVLTLCGLRVRKAALLQATGQEVFKASRKKKTAAKLAGGTHASTAITGKIRGIKGSPVIWRELRKAGRAFGIKTAIKTAVVVGALVVTYAALASVENLEDYETQVAYVAILFGLGFLNTVVTAATGITSEKESRSWLILLATPLSEWQIVWGKAVGVFHRCLPLWALLFGHTLLFVLAGFLHPIILPFLAALVIGVTFFLTGTGLWCSWRFKRTTTAVVMNVVLALGVWALVPGMLALVGEAIQYPDRHTVDDALEAVGDVNPGVQVVVIAHGSARCRYYGEVIDRPFRADAFSWDWPTGCMNTAETARHIIFTAMVYVGIAFLFFWLTANRLRQRIE
ncbi:MAG: ABC transporter permease subunit [Phycisphaerae bacterium]|nr:ABC transporter permease subunit [Phycisphaerae bacterium]